MGGKRRFLRRWLQIALLGTILAAMVAPSLAVADEDDDSASISGSFTIVAATRQVDIDIIPFNPRNIIVLRSWYLVPVAILSNSDFYAPADVEKTSLTFGHTGDEQSLAFCLPWAWDVNHDGLRDQICFFRTSLTGFRIGDTEGILRGETTNGIPFEGLDSVWLMISRWRWWW